MTQTEAALACKDAYALTQRCLQEGICPHGCGPMVKDDPNNEHCPVCGFKHFVHPPVEENEK